MYHQLLTLTASLASRLSDRQDATFLTLLNHPKFSIYFSSCCLVPAGDLLKNLIVLYPLSLFYTALVMSGGGSAPKAFSAAQLLYIGVKVEKGNTV